MKKYLFFAFAILIYAGCNKDDDTRNVEPGKYQIEKVTIDVPMDLNFDGEINDDLLREFSSFAKSTLFLNKNNDSYSIDLLWPEFLQEGGELLHKLPSKYEEGMKFDYVNVSIQYYVSIDEENYTLLKGQKIVNDESVYTFTFPDKMEYTGNDKILFTTTQKFLTKEGNKDVIIKAIFKRIG
jgi:hypothetical protein